MKISKPVRVSVKIGGGIGGTFFTMRALSGDSGRRYQLASRAGFMPKGLWFSLNHSMENEIHRIGFERSPTG